MLYRTNADLAIEHLKKAESIYATYRSLNPLEYVESFTA